LPDDLKNLSIHRYRPADYTQHGKNRNKNTAGTDPFVQVKSDKETENRPICITMARFSAQARFFLKSKNIRLTWIWMVQI